MSVYDLTGRKALVTGGARGLGAGMAEALARAGAAVVIGDIREDLGKATADAIRKPAATPTFVPLDVTDEAAGSGPSGARSPSSAAWTSWSTTPGSRSPAWSSTWTPDDIRRMLEVNMLGTALGIKHAFRAMRPGGPAGRGGAVVNIASVAATIAFPGIAVYSATKSAVDRLTRVAADGIRQARLRRTGELRLPGPGADRDGQPAGPGHGDARPVPERGRVRSAP